MRALEYERSFAMGDYRHLFDDLIKYVREVNRDGEPLSKDPLVRQKLADTGGFFTAIPRFLNAYQKADVPR